MFRKILFALIIVFFYSGYSQSDPDVTSCGISISPLVSSNCNGEYSVAVTIESSTSSALEGALFYLSGPTGTINLDDFSDQNNLLNISIPGEYTFSITTPQSLSNICSIPDVTFNIAEISELLLTYSTTDPICPNADGFFSGSLNGPSGIYDIFFNDEFALQTSLGINEINFEIPFSFPTPSSHTIAVSNFSNLEVGDQIGIFFTSADGFVCSGLKTITEFELSSPTFAIAAWGDDPSTSSIQDGFQEGDEFVFLVKKNNGTVYDVGLEYAPAGTMTATNTNDFDENGISVITTFEVLQPFAESFDINLSPGNYNLEIFDSSGCLVYDNQNIFISEPEEITISADITDSTCEFSQDGSINFNYSGGSGNYLSSIYGPSGFAIVNTSEQSFNSLEPGDYFLILTDSSCGISFDPQTFQVNSNETVQTILLNQQFDCQTQSFENTFEVSGQNLSFPLSVTVIDFFTNLAITSFSSNQNTISVNSLPTGLYSLEVTSANGCLPSQSEAFFIDESEPLVLSSFSIPSNSTLNSGFDVSCNGEFDAYIDITVDGGEGNYTYDWSNGATSEDLNAIGAGTYSVIVTDENNCTITQEFNIIEPQLLNVETSTSNYSGFGVSCFGANDGYINLNVSGGTGSYTYDWSNGSTTQNLSNISEGTYSVIVSDTNNCSQQFEFILNEPESIEINSNISSYNDFGVSSYGASDGSIDISVIGGSGIFNYNWSNGETTEDIINLTTGIYSVVVSDENNCFISSADFEITEPDQINLDFDSPLLGWDFNNGFETNVSCYGLSDASISLTVSGGVPPYSFSWINQNSSVVGVEQNLENIPSGFYTVEVTDQNFNSIISNPIEITEPEAFTVNYSYTPSCGEGLAEFTILEIDGSTDPSNEENFEDPNADNGWYYAFNLYYGDNLINWAFNNELPLTFEFDPTVYGDGTYTMLISHTAAGFDNPGICSQSFPFEVVNTPTIDVVSEQILNTSCDLNNGSIELEFNGSPPYSFTLIDSENSTISQGDSNSNFIQFTGLSPNEYTLSVFDSNNNTFCDSPQFEAIYTIGSSDGLNINEIIVNNSCESTNTGSIFVDVTGGDGVYTYEWFEDSNANQLFDNGIDQFVPGGLSTVNGLSSGDYFVLITDSNDCEVISSLISVGNISSLFATINIDNSVIGVCSDDPIGAIDIEPVGGIPFPDGNYVYVWSASNGGQIPDGQQSNQDLSGLNPGDYTLTLIDDSGCLFFEETYTISSLDGISVDINVVENVVCFGDEAIIEYLITGEGIFDIVIDNGSEVIYEETVVNADADLLEFSNPSQACATNNSIAIPADVSIPSGTNPQLTIGDQIGLFYVNESGSYICSNVITWNGETDSMVGCGDDALTPGILEGFQSGDELIFLALTQDGTIYNLEVTYLEIDGFDSVYQPNGLSAISSIEFSSVYSQADPTQIIITDPINTTYTFNLSNANCVYSTEFECVVPSAPITAVDGTEISDYDGYGVSCNGTFNGEIYTEFIGGIEPYTFSWTGPNEFTSNEQNLTFLSAGDYSLTLTDSLGCSFDTIFVINEPEPIDISVIEINPPSCSLSSNASVEIDVNGGVGEYSIVWTNEVGDIVSSDVLLDNVSSGTYNITVTDENFDQGDILTFCSEASSSVEIPEILPLTFDQIITSDYNGFGVSCFGSLDGFISVIVNGGTPPYNYTWFDENNTQINVPSVPNLPGLSSGTFTVIVTDSNYDESGSNLNDGCFISQTITLLEPPQIEINSEISNYNGFGVSCNGATDGSVDLTVIGGVGSFSYVWSNGDTTEDLSDIGAGTYTVVITDENGCFEELTVDIIEPQPIVITETHSDYNSYGVSCNGYTDGFIDLTVVGGTGIYIFDWSNGDTTEDLSNIGAGTYNVIVTDENGCSEQINIDIIEPDLFEISVITTDASCFGSSDGSASLNITGGVSPFSIGTTQILNLVAGTYSEIISDSNGCEVLIEYTINEPEEIEISQSLSNYSGFGVSCNGASDGFIDPVVSGQFPPFSYSWQGPNSFSSNDSFIDDLIAGTYTLTVTDVNGCFEEITVELTQPDPIIITPSSSISQFGGFGVSCNNATDGWINISVTGGTNEYFYSWTGPNGFSSTNPAIDALEPGNYFIEITDINNSCVAYENVFLPNPEPLNISHTISDNDLDGFSNDYNGFSVSCYGSNDGSIGVYISGGSGSYIFTLNNIITGEQLNENVFFTGDPINFLPEVSYVFEDLVAGDYYISVQDFNSCPVSTSEINLIQPDEIFVESIEVSDVTCYGYSDGSFSIDIDGGLAPYSYTITSSSGDIVLNSFNTSETNINIDNLFSDIYTLMFIDFNNCEFVYDIIVDSPSEIVSDVNIVETTCFSNNDGSIELNINGGVPPYDILMYNLEDSLISSVENSNYIFIDSLFQGEYLFEVIDSTLCNNSFIYEVGGPDPFNINYDIIEPSCSYSFDGSISLSIFGGLEPYVVSSTILDEEHGTEIESIQTGIYDLTVTDYEGCQGQVTIDLGVMEEDCFEIPSGFTPNGDGFNDTWVVAGAQYLVDANVQVYNRWGQKVFYSQKNNEYWDGTYNNKPLPIADYYYIIEPINGKVITGRVTIKR